MPLKKENTKFKVVPEQTQPGTRHFKEILFSISRIKSLFRKPKPFNITQIAREDLNLFLEFVVRYKWSKQTMVLQERIFKKSSTYEASLVVEYQWFSLLSPDQKRFLSKYGYYDVVKELEAFIAKWEYQKLKRRSHKVVNFLPRFLSGKSK